MVKLLVENTLGLQEILEIDKTGSYYDQSKVLWDERLHGKLPDVAVEKLGGIKKQDGVLVFDAAVKASTDQKKAAIEAVETEKESKKNTRRELLAAVDAANDVPSLKAVLKALLEELGYVALSK